MAGIGNKMGDALHIGGDQKAEEHHKAAEHKKAEQLKAAEHKKVEQHEAGESKESMLDKIKDKIHCEKTGAGQGVTKNEHKK